MRNNQSSKTAEGMALLRAIEAARPVAERICYDPYARALVPDVAFALIKLMVTSGLYERIAPGGTTFVAARERYIDDFLSSGLSEGLDQVVILGAGLDTRAFRITGIEKTRVFEVDHPASQAVKLKRLQKFFGPLPRHVVFIPMDFNTQALGEQLPGRGYNEQCKTLFIWQGVTYFLTAQAVDSTLAFIAHQSGPGSMVILDYFDKETLSDTRRRDVKIMQRGAQAVGEAYLFGFDRGQIEPFLTKRGLRDVHNATAADLQRLYCAGPNAGRVIPAGVGIVSARVA